MAYRPIDHMTKRQILEDAGPSFLERIGSHIEPHFLAHLVKHKVLFAEESQDILAIQKPSEKKQLLLNHLYQCSVQQFITFCLLLHDEAKRADIVNDIFKLDINELREQKATAFTLSGPSRMPPEVTKDPVTMVTRRGGSSRLWDRNNPEQHGLVCTDEQFKDLLKSQSVSLCEMLTMSSMLPALRQLRVISIEQEQDIKLNASNWAMVQRLINHINTGPMWWIHSFFRACLISHQGHILKVLGVDSELYEDICPASSHQQELATQPPVHPSTSDPSHITTGRSAPSLPPPRPTTRDPSTTEQSAPSLPPPRPTTRDPSTTEQSAPSLPPQCLTMKDPSTTEQSAPSLPPRRLTMKDPSTTEQSAPSLSPPRPTTRDPSTTGQSAPSQPPSCPTTRDTAPCSTLEPEVIRIISDHAKGCLRLLMHHNLYDIGDSPSGKVVHTGKVYIKVDTQHETIDGNLTEIKEEEILKCLPGESSLRVVQVHGPPGAGKTALAEHIVCDWAKRFLEHLEKFGMTGFDKDLFSTMVFIPTRTIKNNIDEAIMDHLLCKEKDKKVLFNHVKQGNGIGLALDAIDEIRSKAVLENVRKYLKYQHTSGDGACILVTTRSDLGRVESTNFDRHLVLQGFTWDQGLDYIKAYFQGDRSEKVLKYTQAHQQQLFSIVTNPLRAHIFCALISEGVLNLDDSDDMSILKLFRLLEQCLIRRKGVKVTEDQCRNLYRLCMHGLLHGLRHFSQAQFEEFSIAEGSHVFFIRKEKTSPTDSKVSYTFPHEMMYEYFAGRYIESLSIDNKKAILLSISVNPAFRNLQKLIFEILLQQDQIQLLEMMTRAILILQHECSEENKPKGRSQKFTSYGKLVKLHEQIQPLETLDLSLLGLQSKKETKEVNRIWDTINNAFEDQSAMLKTTKWYLGLGRGVFGQVTECFQSCSPELRATLTRKTTGQLLPCEYQDSRRRRFVCLVGESRWAEVTFNKAKDEISVNAWTAGDAFEALNQARLSKRGESHTFASMTMFFERFRNLWGEPPASSLSPMVSKFHEELQHWLCKSHHISWTDPDASCHVVHAVGTSRCAEVVYSNGTIHVHAWSLDDAKDVLVQARLLATTSSKSDKYKSITLHVDKYRNLWGQPSTVAFSPEACAGLNSELHQWTSLCKSCHYVCSVGGGRYSEVVYTPGYFNTRSIIRVHAWCVEDACQVLQQYRLSTAASHHVQDVRWFDLYINKYNSLWGQPPSTAFTTDVWDKLSAEAALWSELYREDYDNTITLCKTTPLHNLLVSDMWTRVWRVDHGTIDMEDLHRLVHTGDLSHVRRLWYTNIVVPAGGDQAAVRNMRQELVQARGAGIGKLLISPHFVTQTGEEYTW